MRAYGLRVPVVLASLVAVLVLLFGLQALYVQRMLAGPLQRAVARAAGVLGDRVTPASGGVRVDVRLGLVANLRQAYLAVESAAQNAAGGVPVTLRIEDRRTPALVSDYYRLNAIIEQGRVTGQFVQMDRDLQVAARRMGLTRAQVIVGNAHMYVELVSGRRYLYDVLPLYTPTAHGAAVSGTAGA